MAAEKTPWLRIIGMFLGMCAILAWYFYDANAEQNKKIDIKADIEVVKEIKIQQEKEYEKIDYKFEKVVSEMAKKNEKYDKKFEQVVSEMAKTNIKLAEAVTLFKERTRPRLTNERRRTE